MNIENKIIMVLSTALGVLSFAMAINQVIVNKLSKKAFNKSIEKRIQQMQHSMFLLLNTVTVNSVFKPEDFLCHINVGSNPCELNSEIHIQESYITDAQLFIYKDGKK